MERQATLGVRGGVIGALLATVAFGAAATPAAGQDVGSTARGSVGQVQVTDAPPGQRVRLLRRGEVVQTKIAGELGGIVFRKLAAGGGYAIRTGGEQGPNLRVLSDRSKPPSTSVYDQTIGDGYGYITVRDGTKLAATVHLPGPPEDGPYPTLIEYSGYGYADPSGPESGIQPVASILGYAVVDVNMRGTGCSGGAFDYFETLQSLDGYDVIETIARQPWVMGGEVGMVGVSYGGISQLFVAATNPPSLSAITPLSVIDSTQTTLYPGGILNTGFALEWAQDRVDDSQAAGPDSGQAWAWERIQEGDATCAANQALHPEAIDLLAKTRRNAFYRPAAADPLAPAKFVDQIDVPVFMACQWTDEQTGGHCPTLPSRFTGTDRKWFTFTNGVHPDSLDPETFNRWFDFMELYVAKRRPVLPPVAQGAAPIIYQSLLGVPGLSLPPDPIRDQPDFESALAAFEAQPPVRILFDNGAGAEPGLPGPAFEQTFPSFPPPKAAPRSFWLAGDGRMTARRGGEGADQFTWDDAARPPTDFTGNTGGGKLWTSSPGYEWSQNPAGTALSYLGGQLGRDTAVIGSGELQVWLRSSARNVDLQATVSEVRPDGKETFVQSGWLRTGARKLDRKASTLGDPVPTYSRRDATTLPKGRWAQVRIPLYYQGHVYRQSSRIRVTLSAPGGDQPVWAFAEAAPLDGTPTVAVAHDRRHPSRLVLPVVKGLEAPTGLPACPGLRGQPCRDYVPFVNLPFRAGS